MNVISSIATFQATSFEAINASGKLVNISGLTDLEQLFDLLVEVEWLTGPKAGEKGKLLCSHYCRWPETLIEEANFLEGCFTPAGYKQDKRLVLGYHPGTVTSYRWQVLGKIVEIHSKVDLDEGQELSQSYQRQVATIPTCRPFRRATRIASLFIRDAEAHGLTPTQGFSALEQRFSNEEMELGISPFLFSYMLSSLAIEGVVPNGSLSSTLPEYGEYCEVNGNDVRVIREGGGFLQAQPIPCLPDEEGFLTVYSDLPQEGFFKALEYVPYRVEPGVLTVLKTIPSSGLYKASSIREEEDFDPFIYDYDEDEEDSSSTPYVEEEGNGYYRAVSLPYEWGEEGGLRITGNRPELGFYKPSSLERGRNSRRRRR